MFAMIFGQGGSFGGTLNQTRNRFLGTLFGGAFAYFVSLALLVDGNFQLNKVLGMFVPFVFLCGLIKQNRQWSYFGVISAATAMVIIFGRSTYGENIPQGELVLLRVQQNVIGILVLLVLSLFTFPILAIDNLRRNSSEVLSEMEVSIKKVWNIYDSSVTKTFTSQKQNSIILEDVEESLIGYEEGFFDGDESEIMELHAKMNSTHQSYVLAECSFIRTNLSMRPIMIEEAAMEYTLAGHVLPEALYRLSLHHEEKVLQMIFSLDLALGRTVNLSELKLMGGVFQFAMKIRNDLRDLMVEVIQDLQAWSNLWKDDILLPYEAYFQGRCLKSQDGDVNGDVNGDGDSPTRKGTISGLQMSELESGQWYSPVEAVDTVNSTVVDPVEKHARLMDRLHQAIIRLNEKSETLNNDIIKQWTKAIYAKSYRNVNQNESKESLFHFNNQFTPDFNSNVRILSEVLFTFNAIFFASTHLAYSIIDLGHVMFSIAKLNTLKELKAF